jgi:tetratricopeptide (TPR) repeat protein
VLLYELLTGTTPFDAKALLESGLDEMLRAIRHDEPHKPSTRISTLGITGTRTAQQRRVDVKKLGLLLRGDLDWIVMKCLEKDRTRRYETANGLAADLQRHLSDEPVTAGPPSATYKLRKFVKRNRAQVIAASAVLAALLVAIVGTSWGIVQKSRARSAQLQREFEEGKRGAEESARLVRNAEAVGASLSLCEEALRAGDAAKAKLAMDAARERSVDGGAEYEVDRFARLSADLALSTELDAIDQYRWTWSVNGFGRPDVAATRAREALRRFGADPETASLEDATARVEGSAIRERIVLAMDRLLWWGNAKGLGDVLGRVDADPFRDGFRDAVLAVDRKKVEELVKDPAALAQPPEFAVALGEVDAIPVARRMELLQQAAIRRPSDIALLMTLQALCDLGGRDKRDEKVRWLQAAIAADPRNSAAYTNLGRAMTDAGRVEQSLACYRLAVAVDPKNAVAHNNLGIVLKGKGALDEAVASLRKAVELEPTSGSWITNLGEVLADQGREDEAIACYRKGIELDPKDGYAWADLGDSFQRQGRIEEAIAHYRKALELGEKRAPVYALLGESLTKVGRLEEAIACLRKGLELDPNLAWLHGKLGDRLRAAGNVDEAIACYRKSIELDPNYDAYGALGQTLQSQGRWEEAIACFRKVIERDPTNVTGYVSLGESLDRMGRLDEAAAAFRKAVELEPGNANHHHSLGVVLFNGGHPDQAVLSYGRAVELEPNRPQYQITLALTQQKLGDHDAALESFRKTIELDPRNACAAYNLGVELAGKERADEAIDWYRKTVELDPNYAEAWCNLGNSLQNQGKFAEALPCFRRGHELGSKRRDWPYPSAEWVRMAEMRAALEEKLEDVVAGRIELADDAERREIAQMCHVKGLDHAAVELYAAAFAADPKLADDLGARQRFAAAVSAARAGMGRQSLDWLSADLALHATRVKSAEPDERASSQATLREWQADSDFARFRDAAALVALPAEERSAWSRFWTDVAALLR